MIVCSVSQLDELVGCLPLRELALLRPGRRSHHFPGSILIMKKLVQRSLLPHIKHPETVLSLRELEPRASAVGGEHSAKELASQLSAGYSEPLFCIFVLAGYSAYVAHFVFLKDVWIRNQRASEASRCATLLSKLWSLYIFKLLSSYCLLLFKR
jgi:hypothetical protein